MPSIKKHTCNGIIDRVTVYVPYGQQLTISLFPSSSETQEIQVRHGEILMHEDRPGQRKRTQALSDFKLIKQGVVVHIPVGYTIVIVHWDLNVTKKTIPFAHGKTYVCCRNGEWETMNHDAHT